jgi:hypothetical protein
MYAVHPSLNLKDALSSELENRKNKENKGKEWTDGWHANHLRPRPSLRNFSPPLPFVIGRTFKGRSFGPPYETTASHTRPRQGFLD